MTKGAWRRQRTEESSLRVLLLSIAVVVGAALSLSLLLLGRCASNVSARPAPKAVDSGQVDLLLTTETYVDVSIQPSSKTVVVEDSFNVQIYVDPHGQPVDTVDARVTFDPDVLQVQSLVGSSAGLADQLYSAYDNDAGTVTHSRGQLSGDPPTSAFTLCTITFHASAPTEETPLSLTELTDAYYAGPGVLDDVSDGKIVVEDPLEEPMAHFVASPVTGTVPLTVTFTDQSSGDVVSREWTFGDDVTSTQESPTHTYAVPGVYSPTLTVSGVSSSDTLTRTGYITAYHRADLNQDCHVDVTDLLVVTGKWRCVRGDDCYERSSDLDADGVITVVDIMRLVAAWGWNC